ncbi:hypothetical protein MWN34_15805 [Ancylobacter sp. 6x-1]|uniref:Uncharacterized protein n=1 Tax=Ancylobacter crimeensis TaxID=2579147 RepID=A0ABT0DEJ9_9HYPH|nr:hypothetical protein [Ancylobacter crimeensis]MCK0198378.1 hypothetical protein [Ancylobacter crimeensis]
MLQSVFPVLPALIIAHAFMSALLFRTFSEAAEGAEDYVLPPEAYPA